MRNRMRSLPLLACLAVGAAIQGCTTQLVGWTDRDVYQAIATKQREALGYQAEAPIPPTPDALPDQSAYDYAASVSTTDVPPDFEAPESGPAQAPPDPNDLVADLTDPLTTQPAVAPEATFTLTDALAYAQQHRRALQTAKEALYIAALALTLERHLWTPQFSADVQAVYGNYGEVTNFDQATRFVAGLNVAQRLPYGGEFTAAAISTLVRDVGRSITAEEGSVVELGLRVPFLRGAGHVAREDLIQLERDLTYAVRDYERFRRAQLVDVAQRYFDLLRDKQAVTDAIASLEQAISDLERAEAMANADQGTLLDTGRAKNRKLSEENRLAQLREAFRASADQFKIFIGMPVDDPLLRESLQTIADIERQITEGTYPLLRKPPAAENEDRAVEVAEERRLDLLNLEDQIDDARRGVAVARNSLLPDFDWTSTATWDTDPEHYRLGGFDFERTTWRTELTLAIDDRFAEKNQFRASLIDVNRARRVYTDRLEQVRADVRSAVNQIRLQEQVVRIQLQNLEVADKQREFAEIQFNEGEIDNRDLVEAQDAYVDAQNQLNQAKTDRWNALLEFRLATETLRIAEDGVQSEDPAMD